MKTIMIVEDEQKFRTLISDYLTDEGFDIIEAQDGAIAIDYIKTKLPDLMIIDIMMPQKDGYQVLRAVRKISNIPVIILTALSEDDDQLKGYHLGADDYLTKPYSPKVLVAKTKALLNRWDVQKNVVPETLIYDDLFIDVPSRVVKVGSKKIDLSPKEYDLLVYMVRNEGHVLSRQQILDAVWGYDYDGGDRTVDIHITRLRDKLDCISPKIITLRKYGYKMEAAKHE